MPISEVIRGGPKKAGTAKPSTTGKTGGQLSGKTILTRRRKIVRDSIRGITRHDIRRLARRGGVKRISGLIYDEARTALKEHLEAILSMCVIYVEHRNAKTITTNDVIFSLRKLGRPIYGFDYPLDKSVGKKHSKARVEAHNDDDDED
ncbi:hypothetical protein CDD82_4462 [Ophiocordyceps australis]|uniref:Histone H4 n=1 Tax=Ophiocordyceps australis TaxID=1399860 RepID=A0A2C5YBF7_9HYPO|nr:hypothetical protein CDD82_4462 [Ophiocordyceps australis]